MERLRRVVDFSFGLSIGTILLSCTLKGVIFVMLLFFGAIAPTISSWLVTINELVGWAFLGGFALACVSGLLFDWVNV